MKTTTLKLKRMIDDSYPIIVERGLLKRLAALLKRYPASKYVIITDATTKKLFGNGLKRRLGAEHDVMLISTPPGERSKNRKTIEFIESAMLRAKCDRKTVILALGGGVIGDMAGFVAATYMRGIRYIQIPTTMLAMVDSSIGGKVGIDTKEGKNTIGAFHQPSAVLIDPECLSSMPAQAVTTGAVEAIKMFMTSDKKGFDYLSKNLTYLIKKDSAFLEAMIRRAVYIKAEMVSRDEREVGPRMILNFGHTIGHALEKLSGYTLSHGHAVALGILPEARASGMLGYLKKGELEKIERMIDGIGIDRTPLHTFSPREIIKAASSDKKSAKGRPRYVLLQRIGTALVKGKDYAHFVPDSVVAKAILASR